MFKFQASLLPLAYGCITMFSFLSTLFLACYLHFKKVTENHCRQYEFLPSISSTIGDRSPEMNVFRYGMALTSGLRLGTIYLNHHIGLEDIQSLVSVFGSSASVNDSVKKLRLLVPLSTIFDTIHWFRLVRHLLVPLYVHSFGRALPHPYQVQWKVISGIVHFLLFVSSLKYFVDHTFYCVPLAYSKYSIFEWLLAFTNVAYDTLTYYDFEGLYFTLHKEKKLY
ncbi:transmembrane protein [Cavenderia fasciculata]|uniref:Transmembrane protein n=1 Tax=Cavenderia fasciculata TaxID=261658 RepID=F4Q346_CACFS|nr:uncharacterized protein DFA_07746 [Cavenderia fasciculata]EGG16768.1 transmembrane protein [Cavenderia fasciculata]|eukprot:XP_004355242.1 transmembrane protein [Cavenderia fasciculata]